MVTLTGWTNIVLVLIMGSIFPVKKIYLKKLKEEGKEKSRNWRRFYQFLRKTHPALGFVILAIGFYHGSQAFSLTAWHTGTLLLYTILLSAVVALAGPRLKPFKKQWRTLHRRLGVLVFVFAVIHVFWPYIL